MNEHGIADDDCCVAMTDDPVVVGAEHSGLNRRRLLGGLVAGAAGLLPREVATAPSKIKGVAIQVFNRDWVETKVEYAIRDGATGRWVDKGSRNIPRGASWKFLSNWTWGLIEFPMNGSGTKILGGKAPDVELTFRNEMIGAPLVELVLDGTRKEKWSFGVGDEKSWRLRDNVIVIKRRPDSADCKEFTVEFKSERSGKRRRRRVVLG